MREREQTIILKGADILTAEGFTQVPNHVLRSKKISPGAKLTYAMLLSYAWNNEYCFPGQERLAIDCWQSAKMRHFFNGENWLGEEF
ncbi:MAG TPA: helix-turn-helix domain-containing protein [Dehalococcoidia bacterium]|nr:helix-turn-helix domain-containing protein [Dehalococcoidia bacterium]